MTGDKLLLIDGHSLAYRAYHALPPENFSTATGQITNAVYGFTSMLLTAVDREAPTHVAVAFDLGRQTFRLEEYPEYKAGRAKTPDDFHGQVELIKDVLGYLGVPVVVKQGFEADDVLATLARRGQESGMDTYVASGDKDAFQLARPGVTILYPKRGFTDLTQMTPEAVEDKYGVSPANYRGLAALVGEKADNLPGVPGVGEKTAAKWLAQYDDLPGVLAHADDIKGKAGQNLREHTADVERNYRLNRLLDDLDLPLDLSDAKLGRGDAEELGKLFDQLEFRQFGKRTDVFLDGHVQSAPAPELPPVRHLDAEAVAGWIAQCDSGALLGLASDADPAGLDVDTLALAAGDETVVFSLHGLDDDTVAVLDALLCKAGALAMHDAKPQIKALVHRGFGQLKPATDTELAAYLLIPDARSYDLDELVQRHLGVALDPQAESGTLDLEDKSDTRLGHSAWATAQLATALRAQLRQVEEESLLDTIERPTQEILARMELAGIAVDGPALAALIDEFGKQAEQSAEAAYQAIGHEVNLGSPKQLQGVLFDELDMPKTKRTKTGYTTDADALTGLYIKTDHPFLAHLLAYRDTTKLGQTVVGLQKAVADDGRIHTSYLQTVAATGRLSSKDPNLQNIPVRSDAGRRIRGVFTAAAGYDELLSADYSQIEMRIMAHLSGDESLIAAFNAGEDLHSYVASEVFGVAADAVTPAQRSKVKAMSYGLVYGLSAYGLSNQLRIEVSEAQALMDNYFARFGAVKEYLDGIVEEARGRGYTQTMYGRRRYLPQLNSDRRQLRQMAERAALNAPIQGSAADIMKLAMRGVDDGLRAAGMVSRILLQVHDEVILEVVAAEREQVSEIIRAAMGQAAELRVPLTVNIGHGKTWEEAAH